MAEEVIESYYNIITIVIDFAELFLCSVCLCLLCRDFFQKKRQVWTLGIVYFTILAVQYYIPVYMGGTLAHAAASASCLFFIFFWEKKENFSHFPIKCYLVLVFFSIRDLSVNAALEMYILLSEKTGAFLILQVDAASPAAWRAHFYQYAVCLVMMYLVEIALLLTAIHFIKKAFYDRNGRYEWKEIAILLLPSVAGFTVHMLRKAYDRVYDNETGKSVTDFYISNMDIGVLLIVFYLTILVIVVGALYLFQDIRKRQEEAKNRISLKNQIHDIQFHIAEVERIYTGIRGIRHDLSNHVHVLGQLLEKEAYEEASHYLNTMQETTEQFDFPIKSRNPITDVIINEKYREARQKGILFQSEFSFPPDIKIDAFDISIILNNLIENAFEAVCKISAQEKRVSLYSIRKKNAYLITVCNSFDKELSLDSNGLMETDKEERQVHGLGLKNVKMVADKYHGTLAIEQEQERKDVTVTVMLLIKE